MPTAISVQVINANNQSSKAQIDLGLSL